MHSLVNGFLPNLRKSNKKAGKDEEWSAPTKKQKKAAKESKHAFKYFLNEEDTLS